MIKHKAFPVEPWRVRERSLDLETLAQTESIFALSNGHIGVRGNLDEGDPSGLPGTYLSSFYELRPLPYAEAGFGYPESGQSILNVTNGKLIRLLVGDEPFDVRYGKLLNHERVLDLRSGVLRRDVEWQSSAGQVVKVRSTRLVSFTHKSILAVRYEVEAVSRPTPVVVQSDLVANEHLPAQSRDPRVAAILEHPLVAEEHDTYGHRALLMHRAKNSGILMGTVMVNLLSDIDEGETQTFTYVSDDWARHTTAARLQPGAPLVLTKFVAYDWSSQRSLPAVRDQVDAAVASAVLAGWEALVDEQQTFMNEFWDGADVIVEGDAVVQQAVRFGLFHVLQAGARSERRAIAAKGLTGPGYDGHAFWDTETFVLPVLSATFPSASADALRWRLSTIDLARDRARQLDLAGVAFPWRTIRGQECSAYWPAGTAAFHVNADVAVAALRHLQWTGDDDFGRECALPLLVDTARLWLSLGYYGSEGRFHIDGVTGPDEYSALVDDNTYTNLMAAQNLWGAADLAQQWPEAADEIGVEESEIGEWRAAAEAMAISRNGSGLVEQFRGSSEQEVWDFEESARLDAYPLLLTATYFQLYRKQVVKQADLMLAMHWCGDAFNAEEKASAFRYYEALTVRDSSLSACTQAVIAAEVGYLGLAHDYLTEAATMDLNDLENNTRDGVHMASLAGGWLALVAGFGGLRDHGGRLSFAPRLPDTITALEFSLRWHGAKVRVSVRPESARYRLDADEYVEYEFAHHGDSFVLSTGREVVMDISTFSPPEPPPRQPTGRQPAVGTDG
jgi:alpha,alpha-trehalose phosphorylase